MVDGLLGRSAGLSAVLRGVGARKDQGVEHRLSSTRLSLFAFVEIVEELMIAVALHAPRGFFDESPLQGRYGVHMHRLTEGRPCQHIRDCRVTRNACRLRFAGHESLSA